MSDVNTYSMSDEDFMSNFNSFVNNNDPTIDGEPEATNGETITDTGAENDETATDDEVVTDNQEGEEEADSESDEIETEPDTETTGEEETSEDENEANETNEIPDTDNSPDWDKYLNTPIRVGNTDIVFNSPEEIVQALTNTASFKNRYNSSVTQRNLGSILEKQEITDPNEIALAIDAYKGKPEAIKELLKRNKFDTSEFDEEEDSGYQPTDYQTSPDEQMFDDTVNSLKESPEGMAVLEDVAGFDDTSATEVIKDPNILTSLSQHKANGFYDKIMAEVNRQTTIGKIPEGTPILQSYLAVGQELAKQQTTEANTPKTTPKKKVVGTGKSKKTVKGKPNEQAQRAQAAKNTQVPSNKTNYSKNALFELSDDEFMKKFEQIKTITK